MNADLFADLHADKSRGWSWSWRVAVHALRDAYGKSRDPLAAALHEARHSFATAVNVENLLFIDYPSDTAANIHLRNLEIVTHQERFAIKVVTHGFVVSLYHLWERGSREWLGWNDKNYNHGIAVGKLRKAGILVNPGIDKLRRLTNCLKHDSDELWKSNPELFDPHVEVARLLADRLVYSNYVNVTHELMVELFDAALLSGPQPPTAKDILGF